VQSLARFTNHDATISGFTFSVAAVSDRRINPCNASPTINATVIDRRYKLGVVKIISGGQTGVDRAALDAALQHGVECGGWCPAGRLDEFGTIPVRYPLKEMEQGSFADRTLQNVRDSDATVIIFHEDLRGGSKQTANFCERQKRPSLLIDAAKTSVQEAAQRIRDFVRERRISTLNVAGPRQSEWAEGYEYALHVIESFICSGTL